MDNTTTVDARAEIERILTDRRGTFQHPETRPAEIYLGNYDPDLPGWHRLRWRTKRLGTQAYTSRGTSLGSSCVRPAFANLDDMAAAWDHASFGSLVS